MKILLPLSLRAVASLLFISSLCADPIDESGSLSSKSAAYDGNSLHLTGQVLLDHGLGKMNAEEASLERQESGKEFPFSLIHLKKEVLLTLKTHAELRCDSADLDFQQLKGFLWSKENQKVIYTDTLKKKKNEKAYFRLMSQIVELGISKKENTDKKSDYEIESILAKEDVIIDYANAFTLRADHALYRKPLSRDPKANSKEFQGIVTAYPKNAESKCRLSHQGDVIDADSVDLDLLHSKISMHHPKGSLLSPLVSHAQKGEILFSCDHLTWDNIKNILSLKGRVQIHENAFGILTSDDQISMIQSEQNGRRLVKMIRSKGKTTLQYQDKNTKTPHKLITFGSLTIDREKLIATVESPEMGGIVPSSKQLYYEEEEIGIHANKASMEYSMVGDHLQPISVTLKDNVRLLSHNPNKKKRYGLADRLSYSPNTRTFILAANPGKKVLFWNDEELLRISAQEIHITQDPNTQKQIVKGVGKVQFSFSDEESQLIQTLFPSFQP